MSEAQAPTGLRRPFPIPPLAVLAILHAGAMFGFFYARGCSTLWGLDTADPNVAILAMQAMNAAVRNPVFAVGYFGTPLVLVAVALVAWNGEERRTAILFGIGSMLYVFGIMVPTSTVNVPLNDTLAMVEAPLDGARAQQIWQSYSAPWQYWNAIRAVVAGAVLLLVVLGLLVRGKSGERGT